MWCSKINSSGIRQPSKLQAGITVMTTSISYLSIVAFALDDTVVMLKVFFILDRLAFDYNVTSKVTMRPKVVDMLILIQKLGL